MSENSIRLTQYSHGAGCGCKISPKVLETILHSEQAKFVDPNLLVGNETRDDAAVYDLGNGTSVISTTDFFMPIVDNPFDFGRIAATNAISDIFAMGANRLWRLRSSAGRLTNFPGNCPRSNRRWTLCMPSGGYCAGWRSLHRCDGADFWSGGNGDRTDRAGEEKQYRTSRMQTVPDETAGDRRSYHG